MPAKLIYLLFVVLAARRVSAQNDSVLVDPDRPDAIYLSYQDFRKNNFVDKNQVVSGLLKDDLNFVGKVLHNQYFDYTLPSGAVTRIASSGVWGFYQNGALYVNFENSFCRITTFGAISYVVTAQKQVIGGDPVLAPNNTVYVRQKEKIVEYLLNFYDGRVIDAKTKAVEEILKNDPVLFSEYEALSWQKQKDQIKRFSRRYNEAHPVYFLK